METGGPSGSPAAGLAVSPGRILRPCLKVGGRRQRGRHVPSGLGGGRPAAPKGQAEPEGSHPEEVAGEPEEVEVGGKEEGVGVEGIEPGAGPEVGASGEVTGEDEAVEVGGKGESVGGGGKHAGGGWNHTGPFSVPYAPVDFRSGVFAASLPAGRKLVIPNPNFRQYSEGHCL